MTLRISYTWWLVYEKLVFPYKTYLRRVMGALDTDSLKIYFQNLQS